MKSTPKRNITIDRDLQHWLSNFAQTHNRNLRVLHIGNVASNAYINAKLQRKIGIDAFVIDDSSIQHIMSSPEWEDVDFEGHWGDDFDPQWVNMDLKGYKRPEWFISGGLVNCLLKLKSLFENKYFKYDNKFIFILKMFSRLLASFLINLIDLIIAFINLGIKFIWIITFGFLYSAYYVLSRVNLAEVKNVVLDLFQTIVEMGTLVLTSLSQRSNKVKIYKKYKTMKSRIGHIASLPRLSKIINIIQNKKSKDFVKDFKESFPNRNDQLTANEIIPFLATRKIWAEIFSHFDIVQCYGGHPIFGLIAGAKYVALEHGTLRDFTLGDDPLHRMVALAYKKATHTFITNGDCREYAIKLGIKTYSAMIHPLDFEPFEEVSDLDINQIRRQTNAEILLFSPIRHDWAIKGTDIVIKSLPRIIDKTDKRVVLILCEWGNEIERSKGLIRELDLEAHIVWSRPLPKRKLAKYLKAADVILDQMTLPHFGGTAPQSLAAGTPVIMSYKPESTLWMFSEPAPILPAFNEEEISEQVVHALDPVWRRKFKQEAQQWMEKYHSPTFLLNEHLHIYEKMCSSSE
jgi:hypothetical protein